ncbi:MAG: MetQ/NlpA family ABC transporter substrate-binding protein [Succiniclasticum sp.]
MRILKTAISILLSVAFLATLGCGGGEKKPAASVPAQKKELKYRVMPTATSDLFEAGVKPLLEKKGYKLTPVKIKDSIQREIALDEGNIDFHVDAHAAWINAVNKSKGTHLVAILPLPTVPTGIYAGKKTDLKQIANGDTVAIPNDASNLARSYQLLERLGWIKLDEKKDKDHVTAKDIISNPKNLKFQEMKGPSINAIKTDVAFIILRGSDAYNAKLDFNTVLFAKSSDSMKDSMRIALCIAEKNKDAAWVKDIIAAYKSPEFKEFTKKNGTFWILPDYMK